MSSTEIVPVSSSLPDSFAVYSLPLNLLKQLAVDVAKGGLYFKGQSPEAIYSAILTGLELGLPPMKALRSIHLVQGRPVLSADLMVGLCKQSSVCLHFMVVESTAEKATYRTQRKGDPEPTSYTYLLEDAKRAGLTNKDNWRAHPAAMLRARCAAALARMVYPDLVMGLYEEDEGKEMAEKKAEILPPVQLHSRSKQEIDTTARKTFHPEEDPVTEKEEALANEILQIRPEHFDSQKRIRSEIEEAATKGTIHSGGSMRLLKLFNQTFPNFKQQREDEAKAAKAAQSKTAKREALKEADNKEEPVIELKDTTKEYLLKDLYRRADEEKDVAKLRQLVKTAQGNKFHKIITEEQFDAFQAHCTTKANELKKAVNAFAPVLSEKIQKKIQEITAANSASVLDDIHLALGGMGISPDEDAALIQAFKTAEERLGL